MSTEDTRESGREVAPAPSEPRNEPQTRDPNIITEADRAANPLGAARREREMHRDETGKFAPKNPDDKQQPAGKQAKPEGEESGDKPNDPPEDRQQQPGQVPHAALAAERARRQEAERRYAELLHQRTVQPTPQTPPSQQQAAPPEFWQDPNAAMDFRLREALSPVQQQMFDQRVGMSRHFAVQVHGREAVDQALAALQATVASNPQAAQQTERQLSASIDPVGDVVRWHKQQTAMREIGDDPAAYRERLRAELLAEMQQGGDDPQHAPPAAQRQPAQTGPLPSSFAAARSGGPRGGTAYGGPRPLDQIMGR